MLRHRTTGHEHDTLMRRTTAYEGEGETVVLIDLINALLYENLFDLQDRARITSKADDNQGIPDFELAEEEQYCEVSVHHNQSALLFRVRPQKGLQSYRISRPPVLKRSREGTRVHWRALNPVEVVSLLAEQLPATEAMERLLNLTAFLRDLRDSVIQSTVSLQASASVEAMLSSTNRPGLPEWERLAALRDRPFHPTARVRSGWTAEDYRRYSAECGHRFGLDWVAVRREHIRLSAAAEGVSIAALLLDQSELDLLDAALASKGLSTDEYLALPVHPWQMDHALPTVFAEDLANDTCVPVAHGLGRFVATSSVRTLSPAAGGVVHVKLPLGIASLGALRVLPPHYLMNGERAQHLLKQVLQRDHRLAQRVSVCSEMRWWAFSPPDDDLLAVKPGHLACLVREYPEQLVTETVIPMAAFSVLTHGEHIPALAHLFGRNRVPPTRAIEFFKDLCGRLIQMAFLCFRYGLMPEIHGQNVLVVLRAGRVDRLLLRDHDTLRVYLPWVTQAGLSDPEYIVRPNTGNTLINQTPEDLLAYFQTLGVQVNLHAIVDALSHACAIDEWAFWDVIRVCIEDAFPALDLPSPVRAVLKRQLLDSDTWPTKLVLSPLIRRTGAVGASMPSGRGVTRNPLRPYGTGFNCGDPGRP